MALGADAGTARDASISEVADAAALIEHAPAAPNGLDRERMGWLGWAFAFLAVVSGITTIVLGLRDMLSLEGPGWAIVLAWAAIGLVVLSLAAIFVQQVRHQRFFRSLVADHERRQTETRRRYERRASIYTALPEVHRTHHSLRDAYYAMTKAKDSSAGNEMLVSALQAFASAFSIVAGSPCRASVKRLEVSTDAPDPFDPVASPRYLYVTTLCRHDRTNPPATAGPDWLTENSDFMQVWDPTAPGSAFFSNNLDRAPNYTNSHRRHQTPDQYEYNSTFVWPIQKRDDSNPLDPKTDLWGFLCVDSRERNIFHYDNDFHLGAAIADALYPCLTLKSTLEAETVKVQANPASDSPSPPPNHTE